MEICTSERKTVGAKVDLVPGTPMCSVAQDIEKVGGIEEEFFFEGVATQFVLQLAPTSIRRMVAGRWRAGDQRPFRTWMLVVRPGDPADFNGTVIVEWNNVSGGERFLQGSGSAQLLQHGFAVVGVSAQFAGVEGRLDHPLNIARAASGVKTDDHPLRYQELHHPGDDYSYDVFTQAGRLLGHGSALRS